MVPIPEGAPEGAPDYFGLVAGCRAWQVANTLWAEMGGLLWSLGMLECWRKGEEWKEAECRDGEHRIPGDLCSCGIYAFFAPKALYKELGGLMPHVKAIEPRLTHVFGVIGAAGEIVEHDHGFRAQYAKVLAVFDEGHPDQDAIAQQYNAQIITPEDYDAFCQERGLIHLDQ
jgi:hypothetical protein